MQTGLVALLDRFVADETKCGADKEALHHANELRRLLCARDNTTSSHAKRELDEKRPDKAVKVAIPDYVDRKVRAAKTCRLSLPLANPTSTKPSSPIDPPSSTQASLAPQLLGDAYIELIASRALYNRFPHVDVPELCMWRERLVENSTLGKFSHAYGFPDRLKHRAMWTKPPNSTKRPDNGFETAEAWLTELWAPQLLGFREKIIENPQARNELNRLVLGKDVKLITKEEKPMSYDENSIQCYYIGIYLTGWGYKDEWLGSGHGQNKVQAGVAAAADALKRDSPVLKDAIRQKNELRVIPAAEEPKDTNKTEQDIQVKKRKKEDDSASPDKKKHKKERKTKRTRTLGSSC
ncbi:Double-strand-specific ribonuclease Pac1 [Pyrenophora tritici-repentis]|nr:Double-strand-specific ribonuclease Pac1 [Pyrenophora tritici-repentis]